MDASGGFCDDMDVYFAKCKNILIGRLELSHIMTKMWNHFKVEEENSIYTSQDSAKQCERFLEILQQKNSAEAYKDFFSYLAENHSNLLMDSLSLMFREIVQLQKANEQIQDEFGRTRTRLNDEAVECFSDQEQDLNGYADYANIPEKVGLIESEIIDTGTDKVIWETHRITLNRVPNLGFGIAISGGRDNPHFSNGDPSIAVSDVLKAGPAENKLQINDRVLKVNGYSLDNMEHSEAIELLRDCGNQAELLIRRKIYVPNPLDSHPTKVILQRRNKRDEYGIILGCKFYVKEIIGNSLAAFDGNIKEGDTILKINNISVESLSLQDARRQLEKSKEKLQLTLKKPPRASSVTNLLHKRQNSDLDYTKFQPCKPDNVYQPTSHTEKPDYEKPSINSYVKPMDHLSPYRVPNQVAISSKSPYQVPDLMTSSVQGSIEIPMQSPLYEQRNYYSDTRQVQYNKEGGGAGLRIAGGNHTGIFIAGVQDGSPAQREGIREGDEIIKIDGMPARGMTREEAVLKIMSLEEQVNLVLQNHYDDYQRCLASKGIDNGDRFFIRTHVSYEAPKGSNHLSFKSGDIFLVTDTCRPGGIGEWNVIKLNDKNQEIAIGVIPNKARAEALLKPKDDKEKPGRGSLFRRRSQKRSKSLGRDHWEDVIFDTYESITNEATKFPVYERVTLKEPGFRRPVVIYGGISDICRSKLLKEVSELFDVPQNLDGDAEESEASKSGIIKLGSIRSVIERNKHCVLDVVPSAIDKLNYAQYYPIVINIHADKKEIVKDIRACWSASAAKSSKKMFEQAQKVEKTYPGLFTATIELRQFEDWFQLVRDKIANEQVQSIWMSEQRPSENLADDFLFPMANQLGFGEADMEMSYTSDQYGTLEVNGLHRASSDPNMDENSQPNAPPYQDPPKYLKPTDLAAPYKPMDSSFHSDHPFSVFSPKPAVTTSSSHYDTPKPRNVRERLRSDSRVPYHSSPYVGHTADPWSSAAQSADYKTHHFPQHKKDADQFTSRVSMSQSHYMTSSDASNYSALPASSSKSRPNPPARTDSVLSSSSRSSAGIYSKGHKKLYHSFSVDPSLAEGEQKKRSAHEALASAKLVRKPSAPVATPYRQPSFNGPAQTTNPRYNGHYATTTIMSQSLPSDDVFLASPVSSSFSNQLYMEGSEATEIAAKTSRKPLSSFESYRQIVSNKPFYGAKKEISRTVSANASIEPSAFESYKRHDQSLQPKEDNSLDNHTLLDTASGVFDSAGGVLSSLATGVSIHIPPNAIPSGIKQEIYFKVCQQDGSLMSVLDKSKGETFLSPLVMCGPHGLKFLKPVELRMPHCATENIENWNFSLKSSSDAADKDTWQSVNLNDIKQESKNTKLVSFSVDQF